MKINENQRSPCGVSSIGCDLDVKHCTLSVYEAHSACNGEHGDRLQMRWRVQG